MLTHTQIQTLTGQTAQTPALVPIEAFLAGFALLCEQFLAVCHDYFKGQATIDTVTRALSEATAEPEHAFAEYSHQMSMEQLQRYGMIQTRIDAMMGQIFEEEIKRNRKVLGTAIENGEYFLLNVISRGIESAIYMLHSKERIQTQRQLRLEAFENEQRHLKDMIKVIKALEQTLGMSTDANGLRRIELALGLYVSYFASLQRTDLLAACDQRVRALIKQHLKTLSTQPPGPGSDEHLRRCFEHLGGLPNQPRPAAVAQNLQRTRPALAYESAYAA